MLNFIFIQNFFLDDWRDRWVESTKKGADQGKFEWTAGKFYGDADLDKGILNSEHKKVSNTIICPVTCELLGN